MNRLKVFYKNGWGLSMIDGDGSYGFEVCVIDPEGELWGDPIGWVTAEQLIDIMIETQNREA